MSTWEMETEWRRHQTWTFSSHIHTCAYAGRHHTQERTKRISKIHNSFLLKKYLYWECHTMYFDDIWGRFCRMPNFSSNSSQIRLYLPQLRVFLGSVCLLLLAPCLQCVCPYTCGCVLISRSAVDLRRKLSCPPLWRLVNPFLLQVHDILNQNFTKVWVSV